MPVYPYLLLLEFYIYKKLILPEKNIISQGLYGSINKKKKFNSQSTMQKAKNILVSAQNNMSSCHQFIFIVWQCNTMHHTLMSTVSVKEVTT